MGVRPASSTPSTIKKQGNKMLEIGWEDGHISRYNFRYLRQNCPCAGCNDEWSSAKIIKPDEVALDLEGLKVEPVGGYALSFSFSDQHTTGIYHFDHLRQICPCDDCKKG